MYIIHSSWDSAAISAINAQAGTKHRTVHVDLSSHSGKIIYGVYQKIMQENSRKVRTELQLDHISNIIK